MIPYEYPTIFYKKLKKIELGELCGNYLKNGKGCDADYHFPFAVLFSCMWACALLGDCRGQIAGIQLSFCLNTFSIVTWVASFLESWRDHATRLPVAAPSPWLLYSQ